MESSANHPLMVETGFCQNISQNVSADEQSWIRLHKIANSSFKSTSCDGGKTGWVATQAMEDEHRQHVG